MCGDPRANDGHRRRAFHSIVALQTERLVAKPRPAANAAAKLELGLPAKEVAKLVPGGQTAGGNDRHAPRSETMKSFISTCSVVVLLMWVQTFCLLGTESIVIIDSPVLCLWRH